VADNPASTTNQNTQSGKPFPAWRLPNGIKSASPADLERSDSSFERWIIGSGLIVVLGLLVEAGVAATHPGYDSTTERIGVLVSDWMVALGVAGEVLFAILARRVQTELRDRSNAALGEAVEQAAQANERAAHAELETEKLKILGAWRKVDLPTIRALGEIIGEMEPACVLFSYSAGDDEARSYAEDFAAVFKHAGWAVRFQIFTTSEAVLFEICVSDFWSVNRSEVARDVQRAFEQVGIRFIGGRGPAMGMTQGESFAWSEPNVVNIFVGPKPPPAFD